MKHYGGIRYTIIATHMQRLGELAIMYPNVKACYFSVAVTQNRLDFKVVTMPHIVIKKYTKEHKGDGGNTILHT